MPHSKRLSRPSDKKHFKEMLRGELLQNCFNRTPLWLIPLRNFWLKRLLGSIDGTAYCVNSPFRVGYGKIIHIGKNFFCNYNCMILDHEKVTIGDDVFLAPNVTITTISHPMHGDDRAILYHQDNSFEPEKRSNYEYLAPVVIGNRVWLATGVIVCPGVTIGDNSVIGAGSVVTRDIPPNVFACGAPCRVVREITEENRVSLDVIDHEP